MKKVNHPTSKRLKEVSKEIDPKKTYSIEEAMELVKKTSTVKFDASVEVHAKLGIDPKKSDQQVRSSVILPNGSGRTVKVAVITSDPELSSQAKEAGADLVGEKDLIEDIKKGKINFSSLVASPEAMKLLAPVAKILGPRGLMPNPKDGTVTKNIKEAVSNLKKGQISFKNDDSGNVHAIIGKTSFETGKLLENYNAFMENLKKARPTTAKGTYIKNLSLTSSMGPSVKVTLE